jgi:UPF0176 protein
MSSEKYIIILFYKFIDITEPEKLRDEQRELCTELNLKGRLLIGEEGINGTFEGIQANIEAYKIALKSDPRFSDIVFKESDGTGSGFTKLKITVRKEIVTLGAGRFDVKKETAKEITADEFDALYKNDEDFVVLDLRNDFEVQAGYFEKTFDPKLKNFRDLPEKLSELEPLKKKKVIAVCTGGIRCEKATCLMKREGFENIYQLKDGIHTYMAKYPGKHFKGSLFVFDNRMVTPVVEIPEREIVGTCKYCGISCEEYYSDDCFTPSHKIICCEDCLGLEGSHLRKCTESKILVL